MRARRITFARMHSLRCVRRDFLCGAVRGSRLSLPRSHVVMVELFSIARVTVLTAGMHDRDAYWQSLANEVILAVRASVRSCAAAWHTV